MILLLKLKLQLVSHHCRGQTKGTKLKLFDRIEKSAMPAKPVLFLQGSPRTFDNAQDSESQ
jgi:hypothetical protein